MPAHNRIRTRRWGIAAVLLAVVVTALTPARTARAAAYTYSTRQRTLNAGILLVDDAGSGMIDGNPVGAGASDPAPYVFYVLNQRADIKPLGWNFVNPLAPPVVTGTIQARWDARSGVTGGNHVFTLNQPVTPNMAPYWEVPLSTTLLDDLLQFDVLLINIKGGHTLQLTMDETEKLRRFVDGGGQLWVEGAGGNLGNIADIMNNAATYPSIAAYGPLPFDVMFGSGSAGQAVLPTFGTTLFHHPIVDTPYQLSNSELNSLGGNNNTGSPIIGMLPTSSGLPDPSLFVTVISNSASGKPIVTAGQLGAGQVVVDSVGSAGNINQSVGGSNPASFDANSGPYCGGNFAAAPVADLKFVTDILSWDTAHPSEHKTSHQNGGSRSSLGPAVTPLWNYPVATPTAAAGSNVPLFTPGAAITGDYAYVRDVNGVLRAFNTQPGTDILGTGIPDAGYQDYITGFSYDEIWDTGGHKYPNQNTFPLTDPYDSAPIVATVESSSGTSQLLVFIEGQDGSVYALNGITGVGSKLPGSGGSVTYQSYGIPAPAPTYYGGYVFAGQPDGSLYVYSYTPSSLANAGSGVHYPVAKISSGSEPVIAPPSVGVVLESVGGTNIDDIVAAVTTTLGVYTVQVGSRHDPLSRNSALNNQYAPKPASAMAGGSSGTLPMDTYAPAKAYQDAGGGYPAVDYTQPSTATTPPSYGPPNPNIPNQQEYADYMADFVAANQGIGNLTRETFTFSPGTSPAAVSAPAEDSHGYFYYTVNLPINSNTDSALVCMHDARQNVNSPAVANRFFWRFRLPYANEHVTDADGIPYSPLEGFVFSGAPVTDSQGNVFALATVPGTTQAAIVCFNSQQAVTVAAIPGGGVAPNTVTVQSMSQPITGTSTDEFGGQPQPIVPALQYNAQPDLNGNLTFLNFGTTSTTGVTVGDLAPNVSEPEPVSLQYTTTSTAGAVSTTNPAAALHTNMAWYARLDLPAGSLNGSVSAGSLPGNSLQAPISGGLTLVGNYLYFGDNQGRVYRFYAYPGQAGLIGLTRSVYIAQKVVNGNPTVTVDTDQRPILAFVQTTTGAIGGVLSAGNNAMIANGIAGITALSSSYSLVADSNRVLELDSEGLAAWAVDSTTEPSVGGTALTHLALNHPSSISQVTPNDYLVADTGNNRCVRFDRAGNVLWELSRFTDLPTGTANLYLNGASGTPKSAPLLTPGEPTTLNHPTSIQSFTTNPPDPINGGFETVIHYLIADTGNYRVLEVVDIYNSQGQLLYLHDLAWISHTYDRQGRRYRFASASPFTGPAGSQYVAALVTNARIATPLPVTTTPASGQLNPASADAPGSSLVLLDYDPINAVGTTTFGSNGQADGYIAAASSTYFVYLNGNNFDVNGAPKLYPDPNNNNAPTRQAATSATGPTQLYLRNPRFLQTYTPVGGTGLLQNFLLADDNGVYDLFLNTSVTPHRFEAQWGMTQADYRGLTIPGSSPATPAPIDASLPGLTRVGLPFVPNSIQRIATESVPDTSSPGGAAYLMGHYLITNGYSGGTVTPGYGFGGESLEVNDITMPGNTALMMTQDYASVSKPANTSPLSQPAFAVREK